MSNLSEVFFSIIITTRNRPVLFKKALESVLGQDFNAFEVIVVNDGSTSEYQQAYQDLMANYSNRVCYSALIQRSRGHGHSYAMNHGASIAKGQYLCFLDDDDYWIDMGYLSRLYENIRQEENPVDLYISNQNAYYSDGTKCSDVIWVEDLVDKLDFMPRLSQRAYPISLSQLLRSDGFAHLNCLVFRKEYFITIDGMDENLRYEDDRDVYYRSIDRAQYILYDPIVMSHHNIPIQNECNNLSTMSDPLQKRVYQLRLYEKGILYSQHEELAKVCRYGKSNQLKFIAEDFAMRGKYYEAASYAWQGLVVRFNIKWLLYSLYLSFRCLFVRRAKLIVRKEGV
ncbi:glycosyltransferase family 2 protein [Photobacterium nomapromontoriensis]|uniref:glycosyltransferase family 2 protein n=1 Tax=Photobacterium nomapromontoriensis TaxID=2910237 RepID=UPI003D0B5E2D